MPGLASRPSGRRCQSLGLLLAFCLISGAALAESEFQGPLLVGVAANFAQPAQYLADRYTEASGIPVDLIVGSTGLLFAQIVQGAPFDLLLAADTSRPLRLQKEGLGADDSYAVYARGRLALWVPGSDRPPDVADYLSKASLLAYANPKVAPYGAAAAAVAAQFPTEAMERRWIQGQNVSATFTQIASGAVPGGLVAYSQLLAADVPKREYRLIPEAWHPPIEQALILTQRGAASRAGRDFRRFLLSGESQQTLLSMGYVSSDGQAGHDRY
ncbi:MAG: molybdate ABC transporter substrate-binding protein [Luminiphilus sp.]|nr:molybdate ABC transporter substrate-binding protein [Luminiphilus sp.]